jgi:hypothetical protein
MTRAGAFSGKAESGFPSENAKTQKRKVKGMTS